MKTVAVIVGSLRRDSINRRFAEVLAGVARDRLSFRFVEIGDLPLYNDDLFAEGVPAPLQRFKDEIEAADGVLFVTPEYNRSFSPAIKNAVDWGTRPWGQNSWAGKPAAIVGATPGGTGGAAGQNALKGLLNVVDTVLMGQPEVYFVWKDGLIAEDNSVTDPATEAFLKSWAARFDDWIDRVGTPRRNAA
ncbi:NADPH-dependent FMN reductase [Halodurantibacterium flavum]|uniref:NADPH-dependent FMN reductase n=1 Tax=Halodurantibacterium flavum TaxID=1382802 RepID=A0ABW4S4L3_9RHOB